MKIRREEPGDREAIHRLLIAAFEGDEEAEIVDRLRAAGGLFLSLVAESDGRIVGHILFTEVAIERSGGGLALGLAPMAVAPEHQRRGVGSRLVEAGLDACRAERADLVVVLGHPEYYPRFGFEPADRMGLAFPTPVPPEAFMSLALASARSFSGRVDYRPEFTGQP